MLKHSHPAELMSGLKILVNMVISTRSSTIYWVDLGGEPLIVIQAAALMILGVDIVLKLPHPIPKPRSPSPSLKHFTVSSNGSNSTMTQLTFAFPQVAKPGSRIRLKGRGRPSPFSQQRGDLYLTIEVLPHTFFRFEGDNLMCDVPIRPDEAVLGAEIKVPTPDGNVTMKVPKGVKSGQSLKLRGKGWTLPKGDAVTYSPNFKLLRRRSLIRSSKNATKKSKQIPPLNPRAQLEEITL